MDEAGSGRRLPQGAVPFGAAVPQAQAIANNEAWLWEAENRSFCTTCSQLWS